MYLPTPVETLNPFRVTHTPTIPLVKEKDIYKNMGHPSSDVQDNTLVLPERKRSSQNTKGNFSSSLPRPLSPCTTSPTSLP